MGKDVPWTTMAAYLKAYAKLERAVLPRHAGSLPRSDVELLLHLHAHPTENTVGAIAERSGMRREATSRCVRDLLDKGLIRRQVCKEDERVSELFLTERGNDELKANCEAALQPLYDLSRLMGDDFFALSDLVKSLSDEYL